MGGLDLNKSVVLVGMIEPYLKELQEGQEVWAINQAFRYAGPATPPPCPVDTSVNSSTMSEDDKQKLRDWLGKPGDRNTVQPGLSRVYFFDNIDLFEESFADDLNDCGADVYTRRVYDQINKSVEFPVDEVIGYFNGIRYYTCTAAYMIAQAIMEGYSAIKLHGMYHFRDSLEYMHHVNCLNFWCGLAIGRGVKMEMSDGAALCRTPPWQPPMYGYQKQKTEWLANMITKGCYIANMHLPIQYVDHADNSIEPPDQALKDLTECSEAVFCK